MEAGHRCAIPTCRHPTTEIAHIQPWSEVQDHTFENLIALCPNCHTDYDQRRRFDRVSMRGYKAKLGLINSRYSPFEIRVLELFAESPQATEVHLNHSDRLHILYLLKDGLLTEAPSSGVVINGALAGKAIHNLTPAGREFVSKWLSPSGEIE